MTGDFVDRFSLFLEAVYFNQPVYELWLVVGQILSSASNTVIVSL